MKISVLFLEYASIEALEAALRNVAAQNIDAELEKIICDPNKTLDAEQLNALCQANQAVVSEEPWGISLATGDYIAISKAGYTWRSPDKLRKQLACMEKLSDCALVMHDVEVVKENGNPVDQNIRNRYMRQVGFEERVYQLHHLQQFARCGFEGTWLLKNIFRNEKELALYRESKLEPAVLLPALLAANGRCENLFDDRLVACQYDEALYNQHNYPVYDMTAVAHKEQELEALLRLMQNAYGITLDGAYRRLHIANGAFNHFAKQAATEQSVKDFLSVYEKAYDPAYLDPETSSPESGFFSFLRDKIRKHVAYHGSEVCLPLVPCIDGVADEKWIYSIRDCKNKAIRAAMEARFALQNSEAKELVAADIRENAPLRKFFSKVVRKIKKLCGKIPAAGKRLVLWRMRKQGYTDYMSREWYGSVRNNLLTDKDTPLKQKLWCYRRGFMPWRLHQYDLTEENFKQYLSDRDYMYLHQMNNSYKKWIEDKMTFRLVLDPFKQHLPKYYFQILQRDDRQMIVKLPDLPEGFEPTFDELFRLLRQEGKLALKAASGTHGIGFYKMHYEDGKYYLNNQETSEQGIRNTINSFRSFYVVTDYINQHDQIKAIYGGSVNTIRIMMLNRDGHHPQVMDAYMRIGSVKSGVTDNVAFGGVVCTIDLETGEYGNGMQIKDHRFIRIDNHPDTGTPLNGIIPNWEMIKQGIVDISSYMCQLEYLGFDVVCTPEGFVLLEINSHQDLHRLRYYDQRVKDFFFYKLRRKERRYKINRKY